MNSFLLTICLALFLLAGCSESLKKGDKILPIELGFLSNRDTIKTEGAILINSSRFFIVKNPIKEDSGDSSFLPFLDTMNRQGIDEANYLFYKESNKTNAEHLLKFPKDLDRYSQQNDLFLEYMWTKKQKRWMIFKYKDGEIISKDSKIKITDIQ